MKSAVPIGSSFEVELKLALPTSDPGGLDKAIGPLARVGTPQANRATSARYLLRYS